VTAVFVHEVCRDSTPHACAPLVHHHNTQAILYLVDLITDPAPAIRGAASAGLDAVIDADIDQDAWAPRLMMLKFEAHNQVWLSMVQGGEQQAPHQPPVAIWENNEQLRGTLMRPAAALGRHSAEMGFADRLAGEHHVGGSSDLSPGAVDYGVYAGEGGQVVLDIESYQMQAAEQHQLHLQQQQDQLQQQHLYEDELIEGGGWDGMARCSNLGGSQQTGTTAAVVS